MESLLRFYQASRHDNEGSHGQKLVPWLNWEEWNSVRQSLFASSQDSVGFALGRVCAWRTRGCFPVVVEVTASIIEIQQQDPFFRVDANDDLLHSEEMLGMLYCMAIMRLVNGVVEKTRKATQVSIAEAADAIGIPRMLIDIRHEGSHRDLPSLWLVRLASVKVYFVLVYAVIFLLLFPGKHGELLCGRNKFFSVMTGKLLSSNSGVPKKQITRILKNLVLLYSSYSSEVVSVLLDLLLKTSDSLHLAELLKNSQIGQRTDNMQTVFDDWKLLLTKFSNKEPELPLTLLKAVLDMIQTREAMKIEIGGHHLILSEDNVEIGQIELLSSLFAWLVEHFKGFYSEIQIPKATLLELLRKCLLVSAPDNKLIMGSALLLAQMAENNIMIEKLSCFCLLGLSKSDVTEETAPPLSFEKLLVHQEDAIRQAAEKLELVKGHRVKGSIVKTTTNGDDGNHTRWVVAKSWNPCPIGMLPRALGSSGRLPALDHNDNQKMPPESSERREQWELKHCSSKREACFDIEMLDDSSVKKMRETVEDQTIEGHDSDDKDVTLCEGVKGQLLINGVWKKVEREELLAIKSAVRIFCFCRS
ncbi:uncharacterized protein LOC117915210 [Vitis riparia]|uniref:uncharacterized protein LOC117915210 n=1 Tax=Vitis riparia TaxID=96939 RepID=UPI00155A0DAF|nr:uncharacterized protein LOC117915210 [Vitis riparia]